MSLKDAPLLKYLQRLYIEHVLLPSTVYQNQVVPMLTKKEEPCASSEDSSDRPSSSNS